MENSGKITLEEIQYPIAAYVRSYEGIHCIHSPEPEPLRILHNRLYLSHRGKQLRPLLVLLSAGLFGPISERTYMGASLVEMIHTASLIHDDVVDEAYVRRNAPSVNALWHSRTAVLIGDFIFARSYHTCLQTSGVGYVD